MSAGIEREIDVLHALGAAGPVAVVEVEAFALQDEGADAILDGRGGSVLVAAWEQAELYVLDLPGLWRLCVLPTLASLWNV